MRGCVCLACVCIMHAWCPGEDIGFHGTGLIDDCESSHGCWELTLGPLQKQQVAAELLSSSSNVTFPG